MVHRLGGWVPTNYDCVVRRARGTGWLIGGELKTSRGIDGTLAVPHACAEAGGAPGLRASPSRGHASRSPGVHTPLSGGDPAPFPAPGCLYPPQVPPNTPAPPSP